MIITDLSENHELDYIKCLECWSREMDDAGNTKEEWFNKNKSRGLRVKIALNDKNEAVGMIQYIPIENSYINGEDLYFILCIWVHGYKEGVGNYQGKGIGSMLLEAAEKDVKQLRVNGMAAWGLSMPFWMKASWYKKHGYKKADKDSIALLVWKPFNKNATKPSWVKQKKKPVAIKNKVTVTSFVYGWCPAQNIVYERAKKVCNEIGDPVVFNVIDTTIKSNFDEWGIVDALFVDKKQINTGPPPTYETLKKIILKKVNKIKKTKIQKFEN